MAALNTDQRPIVVVTEGGPHIWAIVNALAERLGPVSVILETPESKKQLLLGRARRQGWISAIGQLGTMVLTRLGKRFFAGHAARLIAEQKLEIEARPGQTIIPVSSANAPDCLQAIADIRAGVVLLAGCRLLSRQTLAKMPYPVLNYHAGIAPKYRGMKTAATGRWPRATARILARRCTWSTPASTLAVCSDKRPANRNQATRYQAMRCARRHFRATPVSRRSATRWRGNSRRSIPACPRNIGTIQRSGSIFGPV